MNIIVVSDLRYKMLAATASLKKDITNSQIWISESVLLHNDFGQKNVWFTRVVKRYILKWVFGAKIIGVSASKADFECSQGVYSSLVSITNDSMATSKKYPELFEELKVLDSGSRDVFTKVIEYKPERVYVFNGRLASSYSIASGCLGEDIPVVYYEYGAGRLNYKLTNFSPHNMGAIGKRLVSLAQCGVGSLVSDYARGMCFIKNKLNNKFTARYSERSPGFYGVTVFLSSPHEYMCLDKKVCGFDKKTELEFVKEVFDDFGGEKKMAVRCHPNQRKDPSWEVYLAGLMDYCRAREIEFFPPNDETSSYDLIKKSDYVAVDISSIGVDAFFLGSNVLIYGKPYYKELLDWVSVSFPSEDRKKMELASILSLHPGIFNRRMTKSGMFWGWFFRNVDAIGGLLFSYKRTRFVSR